MVDGSVRFLDDRWTRYAAVPGHPLGRHEYRRPELQLLTPLAGYRQNRLPDSRARQNRGLPKGTGAGPGNAAVVAVYAQAEPGRPVRRLYGLGGGFSLHGMFRYFRCGR